MTTPTINLFLPDGDEREIKKVFTEVKSDGSIDLYVTVSDGPKVAKLAEELCEIYSIFGEAAARIEDVAIGSGRWNGKFYRQADGAAK